MTFLKYTLKNTPISALMYLEIIEPEKPGFDYRTFECPRCQHVESVVAEFQMADVNTLAIADRTDRAVSVRSRTVVGYARRTAM